MRTIIDSIRAVSGLVERLFGEPPTTKDIHEGFTRPCTYVQPIMIQAEKSGDLLLDTFEIQIIRLAEKSEIGYLDLLHYQAELREALEEPVPVSEDFNLYPEDVSFDINRQDMALVTSFTVTNAQIRPDTGNEEYMGELEIKRKD